MLKALVLSLILPLTSCASHTKTSEPSQKVEPKKASKDIESANNKNNVEVVMYTSTMCGYCQKAKDLLHERQINFKEINVEDNPQSFADMEKKTGKRTVPQIMINDVHFGSYKDLVISDMFGNLQEKILKNPS